ncbi:hypothetical protein F8154_01790 [Alkaliphilus pronyensis]|uniref:Phosphotriesterase n=1 Tax=Alkaliphilus pronyensis TaxID=1482732 RepID=A0A6I0FH24_9FIRM|nr:hypothetical protein [Alkaliphilus pronyensis]KAB3538536.1 hypothetical protein F8154_01790 [Alkaliphilus pronyensis]
MIYTVKGPIKQKEMGITLSHEHFKWECDENLALSMYYEKRYDDEANEKFYERLLPIMMSLKKAKCRAVVEASPPIGGQNLRLLKKLSEATDIHIIPCTGMNITKYAIELFPKEFSDQLADRWINDFNLGLDTIDNILIRPGYIKLLLDTGELSVIDREMLRAAVKASNATGMPIHCHIFESEMVEHVIELLKKENMDLSKFLWAHGDYESNISAIVDAIKSGIWVGIDLIKSETHQERCDLIKALINKKVEGHLLLSQDYDFYEMSANKEAIKNSTSLLNEFIPYCIEQGIESSKLIEMLSKNPSIFYNIGEN